VVYSPIQDGIDKTVQSVRYSEARPPAHLMELVHCYWELKTVATLTDDFLYHALPDACVNLLFNQVETDIAGITALRTTSEVLNLGKSFHYVGVQFFPGVWQGNKDEIVDTYVGTPYLGSLPLTQTSAKLVPLDFPQKIPVLSQLVEWLISEELVVVNATTQAILTQLDDITSVTDMAALVHLSPRQLQRTLKESTGLSPHDLLKVLRMQQSFRKHYLDLYADQSHFIHSFRKLTGYTPTKYNSKFDV
jgi:AraC-like DNA-binding protein